MPRFERRWYPARTGKPVAERRKAFEARFGALGTGGKLLTVGEHAYPLADLMERLGLAAEGCRSIDARALGSDRFVFRYLDGDDQCVVAYEFDPAFRYLGETRVHVAEWIGEGTAWISS